MEQAALSLRVAPSALQGRGQSASLLRNERVLRFPTDRSIGFLWGTDPKNGSTRRLGNATGAVAVPLGCRIELSIHIGRDDDVDLSSLSGLAHDDLWSIALNKQSVADEGLRQVGRLTGLRGLDLCKAREITNTGIGHLAGLAKLKCLDLYSTAVTDAGLIHVRGMMDLEELHLGDTRVTDEGLLHLQGLPRLKRLNLHGTDVTDAAVPVLEAMKQLKRLVLWGTTVTLEGLELLKISLPHCAVTSDGGGENFNALASAVRNHATDSDAWFVLALALHREGRHDRAIPLLREAIRINPRSLRAWVILLDVLETSGRSGEAATAGREAARALGMSDKDFASLLKETSPDPGTRRR